MDEVKTHVSEFAIKVRAIETFHKTYIEWLWYIDLAFLEQGDSGFLRKN
jgi:hypothetical protein